ncbi:MAG: TlyA family RNA methyltransferase [Kiritimatiellia bacterium]|mgnify:CR=1 FL=1
MSRMRLDQLLVERGLAESREKAQRLIRAGEVLVKGQPQTKPGHEFDPEAEITIKESMPFVGRGGQKLEEAFSVFGLDVTGKVCLDIGASTGGFTDCLLQHGAQRVYAIDVGTGQLHWQLRSDPRVVVMEKVNARHLKPEDLPEQAAFAVIDVSFISLTKILPAVTALLQENAELVTLIKPQFEAGREKVQRGGVVRDEAVRAEVVESVKQFGTGTLGLKWMGVCTSPIKGPAGNVEFLAWWKKDGQK